MSGDFNWNENRGAVIAPRQDAIAVYTTEDRNIVIRREADWNEEDDSVVIIDRKYVRALIDALEKELREVVGGQ